MLLGVHREQAFTFQILQLIAWEAAEVPPPLPLRARLLKSLLQPLRYFPALAITCTFSFPPVLITERFRAAEFRGRIYLRLGLHFKRVSGCSMLAGWGRFCLSAPSASHVSISVFRRKRRNAAQGSPARDAGRSLWSELKAASSALPLQPEERAGVAREAVVALIPGLDSFDAAPCPSHLLLRAYGHKCHERRCSRVSRSCWTSSTPREKHVMSK